MASSPCPAAAVHRRAAARPAPLAGASDCSTSVSGSNAAGGHCRNRCEADLRRYLWQDGLGPQQYFLCTSLLPRLADCGLRAATTSRSQVGHRPRRWWQVPLPRCSTEPRVPQCEAAGYSSVMCDAITICAMRFRSSARNFSNSARASNMGCAPPRSVVAMRSASSR